MKYLQFFIFDSNDNLEKFLNKINQKEEKEIEFDLGNNLKPLNNIEFNKNLNNINNININSITQQKGEKQRNLNQNNLNNINIINFNLDKNKEEKNNNEIKISENFSGIFEEENEEPMESNKKNNWKGTKKEESCNINIISEMDDLEDKKRKSSNELSYKKNFKNQTTSDKNKDKNEDEKIKELKSVKNINEFKLEDNKIINKKNNDKNSNNNNEQFNESETVRKKSQIIGRKKKVNIIFE